MLERTAVIVWLAVAALAAPPADAGRRRRSAPDPSGQPIEAPAEPFSPESLEAIRVEIVAVVEDVAGRRFSTPVKVEFTTSERFSKVLRAETRLIYDQVYRASPEPVRQRLAESQGRVSNTGLLGKYAIQEDTLFLNQSAIEGATRSAGLADDQVPDVLRLILAHELAHGLHDDVSDLSRILSELEDLDALRAASCTWEGLATWIEEEVAERLDLMDVYDALIGLQGWSRTGAREPAAYPVWALYGIGRDFITHHHDVGGADRVWEIVTTPPTRSAVVFRPETYGIPKAPASVDYSDVLVGTEQKLTKGAWLLANTRLGEYDLRGDAVYAGNEAAVAEVLSHLEAARMLSGSRLDNAGQGEIRILDFDDASWAATYLALLRDQENAQSSAIAAQLGMPVEVSYAPFEQVPSDDATLRVARLPDVGGTAMERHQAWVQRSDIVVVVSADNFRPGLRLGWTVEAVFEALDTATTTP